MADYEDTKVNDLIINNMSQEKFDELKDAGELDPTQLYCTPEEGGAELPDQTDNAGKFLMTDGTTASWGSAFADNYPYTQGSLFIVNKNQTPPEWIGDSVVIGGGDVSYWQLSGSNQVVVGAYPKSTADRSVTIGSNVKNLGYTGSIAIGFMAETSGGIGKYEQIAIGFEAKTAAIRAIQLGKGTNSDNNTFKVGNGNGNFEIMSADGTMPTDRYTITPTTAGTYVPKLTIAEDGTATREWGSESGGASLPDQTDNAGKFLTTDGTTTSWGNALINSGSSGLGISRGGEKLFTSYSSIAIGTGANASSFSCIGIGYNADGSAEGGIAIGTSSRLTSILAYGSVAIGYGAKVSSQDTVLIRTDKNTTGETVYSVESSFGWTNRNGTYTLFDANGNVPRERLKNLVEVLPTADNGYTTVKNFGNGYVEITGYASIGTVGASTGSEVQIDLPAGYTMADTNYWVNIAPTSETTMFDFKAEAKARSTTHFMVAYKNEDTVTGLTAAGVYWEVRGMLATTEA